MSGCRAEQARRVAAKLLADVALTDSELDDLYPASLRAMAPIYWTPISVALRASSMLIEKGRDRSRRRGDAASVRVLDIGAGAGKFCLVGALATTSRFVGVEQRAHLVECAREVAGLMDASRATFVHGVFDDLDPADFDAFYLFNPFEENLWPAEKQFDATLVPAEERFGEDVRSARRFLRAAREGSRVVTYNGIGGPLPRCYELVERDHMGCAIELWVKDG